MWELYGNKYDLTSFVERHPGGKYIIDRTKNAGDITAVFETYHAFSDIENIRKILEKYKLYSTADSVDSTHGSVLEPTFYQFEHYRELVAKVREKYPNLSSVKTPWRWTVFHFIHIGLFIWLLYVTYFSSLSFPYKIITQTGYSICESSLVLFHGFHEGSHYAISIYPELNYWIYKLSAGWLLWNINIWSHHHIHLHHTFTGCEKDPDTILYDYPVWNVNIKNIIHEIDIPDIIIYYYAIFPGQYVTQCIMHFTHILHTFFIKGFLLVDSIDLFIMTCKFILLYRAGYMLTIIHLFLMNMFYFINIVGDHDLYETIQNKYQGKDWVKIQISNSGNFLEKNMGWTVWFGGINYQIEHHLFPNVNHMHLPYISTIVKEFCHKKGWNYVSHNTLTDIYSSVKKRI